MATSDTTGLSYYKVPDAYAGKSLYDINQLGAKNTPGYQGIGYNPDDFAKYLGISATQPLTAGQNLTYTGGASSGDTSMISKLFQPGESPGQQQVDSATAANQDFIKRLTATVTGLPSLSSVASTVGAGLGIPQLQQTVSDLGGIISNLPQDTIQRAQRFGLNDAQRREQEAQTYSEVGPTYSSAQSNLQQAEGNLGQQLGYQEQQNQNALIPYQYESSQLGAASQAAYTSAQGYQNTELTGILDKIQSGIQLSQYEQEQAVQLANQEAQQKYAAQLTQQYPFLANSVPLGPYGNVNPVTNQPIGYTGAGGNWSVVP